MGATLLLAACGGGESAPAVPSSSSAESRAATGGAAATTSASSTRTSSSPAGATAASGATSTVAPGGAAGAECPNGGTVRFGVEPFEASAKLILAYTPFSEALAKALGCKVELFVATSYNAEIEAMRNGKLEIAEYGPLGYVLAHQVARAEAVATFADKSGKPATYWASVVTWPGSGIKALKDVAGHSFAYSDPSSTSGHLLPAYALKKAGIDPDKGVKAIYAGSHTAAFEAIRNHKVEAGEMNSDRIDVARKEGVYKEEDFVTLWRSDPLPQDPITVRGDLPESFKQRATQALLSVDLSAMPPDAQKIFGSFVSGGALGAQLVPQNDAAFNGIRDLVSVLNVDLSKL